MHGSSQKHAEAEGGKKGEAGQEREPGEEENDPALPPAAKKERAQARKVVAESLQKDDLTSLYTLEYKDLYVSLYQAKPANRKGLPNPIVYSRVGKSGFSSSSRTESNLSFGMKDLQRALDPAAAAQSQQPWKWAFEDQKTLDPYYVPSGPDDSTLVFESRFESGNLGLAIRLSDHEYNLVLQNDSLTKGHTQC